MKKKQRFYPLLRRVHGVEKGLDLFDVYSLISLGALGHLEGYPLAFVKSLESVATDGTVVYKHVSAVIGGKKSIALCRVEPFHCSLSCQIVSS